MEESHEEDLTALLDWRDERPEEEDSANASTRGLERGGCSTIESVADTYDGTHTIG